MLEINKEHTEFYIPRLMIFSSLNVIVLLTVTVLHSIVMFTVFFIVYRFRLFRVTILSSPTDHI